MRNGLLAAVANGWGEQLLDAGDTASVRKGAKPRAASLGASQLSSPRTAVDNISEYMSSMASGIKLLFSLCKFAAWISRH